MVVRGFTATLLDKVNPIGMVGSGPCSVGLPVLELPEGATFSGRYAPVANLDADFSLRFEASGAEISFGGASGFDQSIRHGRMVFLVAEERLVGVRVVDLSHDELSQIREAVRQS